MSLKSEEPSLEGISWRVVTDHSPAALVRTLREETSLPIAVVDLSYLPFELAKRSVRGLV